jgi:hypothetical protein
MCIMNITPKNKRKERKFRISSTVIIFFLLSLVVIQYFLHVEDITMYNEALRTTKWNLMRARSGVKWFEEKTGRLPSCLCEINAYARSNKSDSNILMTIRFLENLSSSGGTDRESDTLSGEGGWFYDPNTGEVKVNLTKPVKHYLKFFWGKERNEIPAGW